MQPARNLSAHRYTDHVQREKQGGVWTRGGAGESASTPYNADPYSQQQQQAPYGQAAMQQATTPAAAAAPDQADPYAAYGGYANYYALWQAAMANQGAAAAAQPPQ